MSPNPRFASFANIFAASISSRGIVIAAVSSHYETFLLYLLVGVYDVSFTFGRFCELKK